MATTNKTPARLNVLVRLAMDRDHPHRLWPVVVRRNGKRHVYAVGSYPHDNASPLETREVPAAIRAAYRQCGNQVLEVVVREDSEWAYFAQQEADARRAAELGDGVSGVTYTGFGGNTHAICGN